MVGNTITGITLTDSGDLYTAIPTVTISLPDADSAAATANVILNDSGTITGYSIITDGTYYTGSTQTATITYTPVSRFFSLLNKFGGHSFRPAGLAADASLALSDSSAEGQFRTWVYVPQEFVDDSETQEVMFLNAGNVDSDIKIGAQIRTRGTRAYWEVVLYDSAGGPSTLGLGIDTTFLNLDDWTFVGIDIREKDSDEYFISPVQGVGSALYSRPKTNIHAFRDSATFLQNVHRGLHFDDLHFVKGYDVARFAPEPTAAMDSIGTDTVLLADFDVTRVANPRNVNVSAVVTNNRIESIPLPDVALIDSNEIIQTATISFPAPVGSKEDFRATATAVYDSDNLKVSSVTVDFAGDFYVTSPTITFSDPTVDSDFTLGETITGTADSGYSVTAVVHDFNDSDRIMKVYRIGNDSIGARIFTSGMIVIGETSGSYARISSLAEKVASAQDAPAEIFDTNSSDLSFLDFSEDNPFGDPR